MSTLAHIITGGALTALGAAGCLIAMGRAGERVGVDEHGPVDGPDPADARGPVLAPNGMDVDPRLDEEPAQFSMPRDGGRDGDL